MLIGRKLKGFTRDEKRRDRRTPVALPMQVGSARATMTDISLGGFAFEADSGRVRPGAAFTATVQLEDGTALEVEAQVVRVEQGYRAGAMFTKLSSRAFRILEQIGKASCREGGCQYV